MFLQQDLQKPTEVAVLAELERTFIDKVVPDLGLVVTLYDICDIGEGMIYHSEGAAHYIVSFRVVVFRPFVEETLLGTITHMDE